MLNAGYHAVPPGMIATVVTSLEMLELPTLRPEAPDRNWRLDRLAPDPIEYRRLYRAIGEDWLWFSRLVLTDAELAAIIGTSDVEVYRLTDDADGAGLLELATSSERATPPMPARTTGYLQSSRSQTRVDR